MWLSDGTITVSMDVGWRTEQNHTMINPGENAVGGKLAEYLWNIYEVFDFPVEFIPTSDSMQVNRWFETNQQLTLFYDSTSYDVFIFNAKTPMNRLPKPYQDQYNATLILQRI